MRNWFLAAGVVALATCFVVRPAQSAADDHWEPDRLKQALTEMGYEPKELSDKKWEVKVTKNNYDVPIAAEISASGNYIWLTVYLGDKPADEKAGRLLKRNFKIQPSQFYVTEKGNLMMAIPSENRGMTNAVLKKAVEKVSDDVVSSVEDWSK
ncbi:MAG: hypothetical protein JSS66_15025 [Armatimonadetes bacterium]|nr:hypothetical protein [Armatimonadota bacterium]